MSQRLVLFAKYLLTLDRPQPLEDGFVVIQDSRILQVGRRKDLRLAASTRILDLDETVLLPGLINAHCHLDYTLFKGRVRFEGGFRPWLTKMAIKTRSTSPAEFKRAVQKGIRDSLAYGTTTLCDISTSWESYSLLRQSALRSFVFLELIDLGNPFAKVYWTQFQERLQKLVRSFPPTSTFRWGLSPHTPFTVSKDLLLSARNFMDNHRDLLTTIHVAESKEESRFFKTGKGTIAERIKVLNPDWTLPRQTTPVQYLNSCGWLPKLDLGVHLNEVGKRDLKLLAKNRITVVHCPGSHAFFERPTFRYERMRRHRIPVCLGTDSLASNQSLSLFREMRLFQKEHSQVSPAEILSMVTVKPARALGLGDQLGQIRPGFLADLIGVPFRKTAKSKDPYQKVIDHAGPVSFSMVQGEPKLRVSPGK